MFKNILTIITFIRIIINWHLFIFISYLTQIIRVLERSGWRFYGMTRVKCTVDSLFFHKIEGDDKDSGAVWMKDSVVSSDDTLSALSLNRTDRLRLIEFEESATKIVADSLSSYYEKEYESKSGGRYHGAVEFKLRGSPFDCQGLKSIESHLLVCNVLKSLSCSGKYSVLSTIKVSDKITSKSTFIMSKSANIGDENTKKKKKSEENKNSEEAYACISFSEKNKLQLINFSAETTGRIIKIVSENYLPGMFIIS